MVASALPVLGFFDFWRMRVSRACKMRGFDSWLTLGFTLALTLPCLVYRYLPMVDLPQHEAIVSIMLNLRERMFGFDAYYAWAPERTLYLVPYGLAAGLAQTMPLHRAINVVAFLATIAYPIGIVSYLRAMKRPAYLGLIALPVVYNQSFFWGFINFNLSVGLAFFTISLLIGVWSKPKAVFVALLSCLVALTHVYGLAVLGSYWCLWLLTGERCEARRRVPALAPAALLLTTWFALVVRARGFTEFDWNGISGRWSRLLESVVGGWRGHSEQMGLLLSALAILAFFRHSVPLSFKRWRQLSVHQRVVWVFIATNLLFYFLMPELPLAATKSSFRHAQLAIMAVPLTLGSDPPDGISSWARLCLCGIGLWTMFFSWTHFSRFDAEARSFDAILDAIPPRSRIAQLTYDRRGKVASVPAYMHFAAYAQAQHGGLLAVSFPARFWNMPIALNANFDPPEIPQDLEWNPQFFGMAHLDRYFDTVVLRAGLNQTFRLPKPFPYQLQLNSGPWWLFRKVESVHD